MMFICCKSFRLFPVTYIILQFITEESAFLETKKASDNRFQQQLMIITCINKNLEPKTITTNTLLTFNCKTTNLHGTNTSNLFSKHYFHCSTAFLNLAFFCICIPVPFMVYRQHDKVYLLNNLFNTEVINLNAVNI